MKDLKIIRKNITANEANKFEFDVEGFEFLVKNFNDFDIFVGFKNTTETDDMIKIPAINEITFPMTIFNGKLIVFLQFLTILFFYRFRPHNLLIFHFCL